MQVLRLLQERFARTTQTWARFCAADGDRSFFADVQDRRSLLFLDSLKVSFQSFEDLEQELASLDQSCKETRDIVSRQLPSKLSDLTGYVSYLFAWSTRTTAPARRYSN